MSSILPLPCDLGLDPDRFPSWRPNQDTAIIQCLQPNRFIMAVLATGAGKSAMYMGASLLSGSRTVILVSTKALQVQLMEDFRDHAVDIRGKANYPCIADPGSDCSEGPCNNGAQCLYQSGGCHYYDRLRVAQKAKIVVTNYAYYLAVQNFTPEGLGDFDIIVCDEAHGLPDILTSFLTTELWKHDLNQALSYSTRHRSFLSLEWPDDKSLLGWSAWAKPLHAIMEDIIQELKLAHGNRNTREVKKVTALQKKLFEIMRAPDTDAQAHWIQAWDDDHFSCAPQWPAPFAERYLFQGSAKIILTSASICQKTATMLGVTPDLGDDILLSFEYPHSFPVQNRRVYHLPTIRMNYKATAEELRFWVSQIDNVIRGRQDRKGLIHTVSYSRVNLVTRSSQFAKLMITHTSRDTAKVVRMFKHHPEPRILVSPSITTGYDFPYDSAEYQIIGKLSYPDTRDPLTKARCESDQEYAGYVAMQELVQAAGRICRAGDDHGETVITDDNVIWFMKRNRKFAPKWFLESVVYGKSRVVPPPPPKQTRSWLQSQEAAQDDMAADRVILHEEA